MGGQVELERKKRKRREERKEKSYTPDLDFYLKNPTVDQVILQYNQS